MELLKKGLSFHNTTWRNAKMRRMGYYFIVSIIFIGSMSMAEFVSAQTYASKANTKLIITESPAQPRFAPNRSLEKDGTWAPSVSDPVYYPPDDPSQPVIYGVYEDRTVDEKGQRVPFYSTATTLDRTQGDYFGQVVIINWAPSAAIAEQTAPNLVTMPQARAAVFENNGVSAKDYYAELSRATDSPWEDRILKIRYRVDVNGQPLDVFQFNIQHPWDNCNFRMLNEVPTLVNNLLPSGNKINEQHFTYIVINQAVFQNGGCTNRATATVSPVRSMQTGNIIWMPEDSFLVNQYATLHEMGHVLGLGHSRLAWSNGSSDPLTWPTLEYGDPACIMAGAVRRLNSYQLAKLGWYKGNASSTELRPGMTYTAVAPSEIRGFAGKSIRYSQNDYVLASTNGTPNGLRVDPEIRQNAPFDSFVTSSTYRSYKESVALRWGDANLTAAATSSVLINTSGIPDSVGATLALNQPFTIWNLRFTVVNYFAISTGARFQLAHVN
jgi:hypothetical protein